MALGKPIGRESITVKRFGPPGQFGAPGEPEEPREIPGCALVPKRSDEMGDFTRDTVTTMMLVLTPSGADVKATDIIAARGFDWTVDGDPGDLVMKGRSKAIKIMLKKVTG